MRTDIDVLPSLHASSSPSRTPLLSGNVATLWPDASASPKTKASPRLTGTLNQLPTEILEIIFKYCGNEVLHIDSLPTRDWHPRDSEQRVAKETEIVKAGIVGHHHVDLRAIAGVNKAFRFVISAMRAIPKFEHLLSPRPSVDHLILVDNEGFAMPTINRKWTFRDRRWTMIDGTSEELRTSIDPPDGFIISGATLIIKVWLDQLVLFEDLIGASSRPCWDKERDGCSHTEYQDEELDLYCAAELSTLKRKRTATRSEYNADDLFSYRHGMVWARNSGKSQGFTTRKHTVRSVKESLDVLCAWMDPLRVAAQTIEIGIYRPPLSAFPSGLYRHASSVTDRLWCANIEYVLRSPADMAIRLGESLASLQFLVTCRVMKDWTKIPDFIHRPALVMNLPLLRYEGGTITRFYTIDNTPYYVFQEMLKKPMAPRMFPIYAINTLHDHHVEYQAISETLAQPDAQIPTLSSPGMAMHERQAREVLDSKREHRLIAYMRSYDMRGLYGLSWIALWRLHEGLYRMYYRGASANIDWKGRAHRDYWHQPQGPTPSPRFRRLFETLHLFMEHHGPAALRRDGCGRSTPDAPYSYFRDCMTGV